MDVFSFETHFFKLPGFAVPGGGAAGVFIGKHRFKWHKPFRFRIASPCNENSIGRMTGFWATANIGSLFRATTRAEEFPFGKNSRITGLMSITGPIDGIQTLQDNGANF